MLHSPSNTKTLNIEEFTRIKEQFKNRVECLNIDKGRLETALPKKLDSILCLGNHTSSLQKQIIKEHAKFIGLSPSKLIIANGGINQIIKKMGDLYSENS